VNARARVVAALLSVAGVSACNAPTPSPPLTPPASVASSAAPPFVLAIARITSTASALEPIVRFTGTEWVDTWPAPEDMRAAFPAIDRIPDAWLGRPVPRDWTVWSSSGETTRAHATSTRRGDGCEARIQLSLERTAALDALGDADLVAVDTDLALRGFAAVGPSDPDRARIEPVVREAFLAHERRGVDADRMLKNRLTAGALAALPVVIKYLVRPASSASALFYFEATKGRATLRGGAGLAVSGWLRPDAAGRLVAVDLEIHGIGGDNRPVPGRVPRAGFTLAGREYLLIEGFGYEGLWADLLEVTAGGVVRILSVARAGC
jgi:hypothetical protein